MSDEHIKKLEARIAELEAKLNPPPPPPTPKFYAPFDLTAQMAVPVRLTGRETYRDVPIEEALNDARKERQVVGQLRPLAEFLSGKPSADPPKAEGGGTVPRDDKVPGQDLMDAIAKGFADRERLAAIAEQLEVARKLRGG